MTISSETNKVTYTGDGSTTVFPYTFKILDEDHILVQLKNISSGALTTQTITTHYTVSGVGTSTGGNITFLTAPSSAYKVVLTRDVPATQETDYEEYDTFPAASHEEALDKLTMIDQQQQEQIDRSIKVDPAVAGFSGQILGTPAAYNQVRVNSGATGLEFATASDLAAYSMPGGTGLLYQSATSTAIIATLAGAANNITVTESPTGTFTFTLPNALTFTGKTVTGGTFNSATMTAPALAASSGVIMTGFAIPPQGRLTLASATPVPSTDQTAKTTLYYTPYVGTRLALYASSTWKVYNFTELSIAVPATTVTMYDVFVYDNAGTLTLELTAWTNDTTRATALAYQDGMLVKSDATSRLFLGSMRTTGVSGQTQDARNGCFISNYYNQVSKHLYAIDTTDSWTYTSTTIRQARATATNKLQFVRCSGESNVSARVVASVQGSTTAVASWAGIGLDSSTVNSAILSNIAYPAVNATGTGLVTAVYEGQPGAGFRELYWLEANRSGSGTMTVYGDIGDTGATQSGITGVIMY